MKKYLIEKDVLFFKKSFPNCYNSDTLSTFKDNCFLIFKIFKTAFFSWCKLGKTVWLLSLPINILYWMPTVHTMHPGEGGMKGCYNHLLWQGTKRHVSEGEEYWAETMQGKKTGLIQGYLSWVLEVVVMNGCNEIKHLIYWKSLLPARLNPRLYYTFTVSNSKGTKQESDLLLELSPFHSIVWKLSLGRVRMQMNFVALKKVREWRKRST